MARIIPGGWGGVFLDTSGGRVTIYLVDTTKAVEARAELAALHVAPGIANAQVWQGRWDFGQLYDWYRYVNWKIGWPEGLNATDIDEYRNDLMYGVGDDSAEVRLNEALAPLSLPCGLVRIAPFGPVISLAEPYIR